MFAGIVLIFQSNQQSDRTTTWLRGGNYANTTSKLDTTDVIVMLSTGILFSSEI
jgi:hypothetical protein